MRSLDNAGVSVRVLKKSALHSSINANGAIPCNITFAYLQVSTLQRQNKALTSSEVFMLDIVSSASLATPVNDCLDNAGRILFARSRILGCLATHVAISKSFFMLLTFLATLPLSFSQWVLFVS